MAAAAYSILATPYYRSQATIEVDERIRGFVGTQPNPNTQEEKDYFVTQNEILKSRVLAELVVDRLQLDQSPEFDEETPEWLISAKDKVKSYLKALKGEEDQHDPELETAKKRDLLVNTMMKRVFSSPRGKTRLIMIDVLAKDRLLAKKMLETYIDAYLELNLAKRRSEDSVATQWLKSELTRVKEELGKSREALSEFSSKHGVVSLESDLNHITQGFTAAVQDTLKSKEGLFKLRSFLAQGDLSSPRTMPQLVNVDHLVKMKEQLALLEAEYSQMKAVYDPSWIKVSIAKKKVDSLRKRIADMEHQALGAVTEAASTEQNLLDEAFQKAKTEAIKLNSLRVEYDILKKEVESNEAVYQMYLQKEKEKEVSAGVTGNNVSLISAPSLPVRPAKPNKPLSLLVGSFSGLMVGFLWAFYREASDMTIKTTEDVEANLSVTPLGEIPNMKKFKKLHEDYVKRRNHGFVADDLPRSLLYDAIRNIQTSLSFMARHSPLRVMVVSSAVAQEGKTSVAVALATVMAEDNMKVLLMDCDLRRPTLHTIFQTDFSRGLSNVLTDPDAELLQSVNPTVLPGLDIMTSGPVPPNPVKLLRSRRMKDILDEARNQYDMVLVDCPPVLGFSEVPILVTYADGVLLVIKEGAVPRKAFARVLSSLPFEKPVGAVLNMSHSELLNFQMRWGKQYYGRVHYRA